MTDPSEVEKLHRLVFELRERNDNLTSELKRSALLFIGLAGHLQDKPESAHMLEWCRNSSRDIRAAIGNDCAGVLQLLTDKIKEGKVTT